MRDPERVPRVLERIRVAWERYPDLRLCQLIGNVFPFDNYYVEDDELLKRLESFYAKEKTETTEEQEEG